MTIEYLDPESPNPTPRGMYYDREGNEITLDEFARMYQDPAAKRVAKDMIGDVMVSTVWLGVNYQNNPSGPPLIFETMAFGGLLDEIPMRWTTIEDARTGHDAFCTDIALIEEEWSMLCIGIAATYWAEEIDKRVDTFVQQVVRVTTDLVTAGMIDRAHVIRAAFEAAGQPNYTPGRPWPGDWTPPRTLDMRCEAVIPGTPIRCERPWHPDDKIHAIENARPSGRSEIGLTWTT